MNKNIQSYREQRDNFEKMYKSCEQSYRKQIDQLTKERTEYVSILNTNALEIDELNSKYKSIETRSYTDKLFVIYTFL